MATPKVTYNLDESPFYFDTDHFRFVFSSELYKTKFMDRYVKKREELFYYMKSKFRIEVAAYDFSDFLLYEDLEIRGFKVINLDTKEVITCLSNIVLDGRIRTTEELTTLLNGSTGN